MSLKKSLTTLNSIFSLILISLLAAGCSEKKEAVKVTFLSPDFVVSTLSEDQSKLFSQQVTTADADCIKHIKNVTCVSHQKEMGLDPQCSAAEVTPEMLIEIPGLIDNMPPFHKKVFCNLNRLQIQSNIFSIAYASGIYNSNRESIGNMIGIRADAITGQTKFDLWSWKEQLNFGLSTPNDPTYTLSPQGPFIEEAIPTSSNFLVLHVLVHELGHLIDFMNRANNIGYTTSQDPNDPNAPLLIIAKQKEGSFGLLSWPETFSFQDDESSWPPQEFKTMYPWLSQLCYYDCITPISPSLIKDVYKELDSSSFLTAYSASNMSDDFAEALTVVSLEKSGFRYKILSGDKTILFDSAEALKSPRLAAKLKWLKDFEARPDLKYKIEPKPTQP